MKNAQNLAMDWSERKTDIGLQSFVDFIESIQLDAFESGRVAGRQHEMLSMANMIESDLPLTAETLRKHAMKLETHATPNPLKSPSL